MAEVRIGSLFSGSGALDMAAMAVFGGSVAWHAETDPGAAGVLARHWPAVPNLGDVKAVDWAAVEPVRILLAGFPCQPVSNAGKRKGADDARWLWPQVVRAIDVLRPRWVLLENVAALVRRGFPAVLADLAARGFDAEWLCLRASAVDAPHHRDRIFILAWPADAESDGRDEGRPESTRELGRSDTPLGGRAPADAEDVGRERCGSARGGRPGPADGHLPAADAHLLFRGDDGEFPTGRNPVRGGLRADTAGRGPDAADAHREPVRVEPVGVAGCGGSAVPGISSAAATDASGQGLEVREVEPDRNELQAAERDGGDAAWGDYGPAIRRWEYVLGRPAPRPVDDRGRLGPGFVEFLMGLPAGHVTDTPDLSRAAMLRILGNGVVPQQGEAAARELLARSTP